MTELWISLSFVLLFGLYPKKIAHHGTAMEEICDNALDDDNDGLIDLNDPDCICEKISQASMIPNPSFEEYNCCPEKDNQLDCADGWDQASFASTDFIHTCGFLSGAEDMLPFPDGEGAVLIIDGSVDNGNGEEPYNEYAGACLNRPMEKDSIYKIKFHLGFFDDADPPLNFTFYGSPSCTNLPFSQNVDCPTNYPDWYYLQSQFIWPEKDFPHWKEVEMIIQPSMDINALVMGGPCSHSFEDILGVYFLDNIRLSNSSNFDFDLLDKGAPCEPDFVFAVAEDSNSSYQWYKAGVAIVGERDAELSQMYGEGLYQLRITDKNTQECRIADDFEFSIPFYEQEDSEIICEGESLLYHGELIEEAGIYDFVLTAVDGCDSIVTLEVSKQPNQVDTIYAQILMGTTYTLGKYQFEEAGEYIVNFTTLEGCDNIVVLYLEYSNVFIPEIFSPNGDNINDYFEVYSSNTDLRSTEMSIFDRWGGLIYKGERWDGRSNNDFVNPGVYVYLIRLISRNGEAVTFSGALTLVR